MDHIVDTPNPEQARLDRLSRRDRPAAKSTTRYSNFVRIMRITLPLCALVVVVILFTRAGVEEDVIRPIKDVTQAPKIDEKTVAQNELLNPKFQSTDKKDQPYEITAKRAVQKEGNKDLILLEYPVGVMTMEKGLKVTVKSQSGSYDQATERFILRGSVALNHEEGYVLESEEAHVDLTKNVVWSDKDIYGSGADISVRAKGVRANSKTGEIIFTGPATLVLTSGIIGVE